MFVQIICEKKNTKAIFEYFEVEEVNLIGDRLIIHQKDEIPYVSTFSSDCHMIIRQGDKE